MNTMPYYLKQGVAMLALTGVLVAAQALGDTTSTPPNNNAPAPLNVSNAGQVKEGGLSVNWGNGTTGAAFGLIVPFGKSGFGTKTPEATLDIDGSMYTKGGTGDANGNGTLVASDALAIWNYYERKAPLTRAQQAESDLDGNGVVTFEDVIMALNMAVGISREQAEYNAYHYRITSCGALPNGDVNLSGAVTALDAQLALQLAVGSASPTDLCQGVRADFDQSGRVTAADAQLILQNAVGLCEDGNRGTVRFQKGGAGVTDKQEVCAKDAAGAFAWRQVWP